MSLWDFLVSIFWFMLLVAWFWLMIVVLTDLFRDDTLSGGAKALWAIFVILLPWIGITVYLIARGRSMNERSARYARDSERAFRSYVQEATASGPSLSGELAKLAELRDSGAITADEYETAKSTLIGAPSSPPAATAATAAPAAAPAAPSTPTDLPPQAAGSTP